MTAATAAVFDHGPNGTYVRAGECCRCGDCCKGDPFTGQPGGYCPLFAWASEGVGHCTDRLHPYYLAGCNVWPTHPGQIADKPNCSYTFERLA